MLYVSDLIGDEYKKWNSNNPRMRNILISAGTGTGKTTFILTKLLLYCAQENKKILFLSNRKALEMQVKEQVARLTAEPGLEAAVAERIPKSITVGLYQNFLPWLRNFKYVFDAYGPIIADGFIRTRSDNNTFYGDLDYSLLSYIFKLNGTFPYPGMEIRWNHLKVRIEGHNNGLYRCLFEYGKDSAFAKVKAKPFLEFADYNFVVLDEIHFLIQDAAFNYEAQVLYDLLLDSFFPKDAMIYMTATPNGVEPLINGFVNAHFSGILGQSADIFLKTYKIPPDYSYIIPHVIMSDGELLPAIKNSGDEKWLIFVDSKAHGRRLYKQFSNAGVMCSFLFRDDDTEKRLAHIQRGAFEGIQCLISTSLLDNGVTIEHENFKNMVILSYDNIEFIQMLGRKRITDPSKEKLNLYVLERTETELRRYLFMLKERNKIIADICDNQDSYQYNLLYKYFNSIRQFKKISGLVHFSPGSMKVNALAKYKNDLLLDQMIELFENSKWEKSLAKMQLNLIGIDYVPTNAYSRQITALLSEHAGRTMTNKELHELKTRLNSTIKKVNKLSAFPMTKVNATSSTKNTNIWLCGAKIYYRIKTYKANDHNHTTTYQIIEVSEEVQEKHFKENWKVYHPDEPLVSISNNYIES